LLSDGGYNTTIEMICECTDIKRDDLLLSIRAIHRHVKYC
jgi:hypothetical protein